MTIDNVDQNATGYGRLCALVAKNTPCFNGNSSTVANCPCCAGTRRALRSIASLTLSTPKELLDVLNGMLAGTDPEELLASIPLTALFERMLTIEQDDYSVSIGGPTSEQRRAWALWGWWEN